MDKKTMIVLGTVVVAVAVVAVAAVMMMGGDSENESKLYSASVFVSNGDSYDEYQGEGETYEEILRAALGDDVVISNNGNVQSYKGKTNDDDHSWAVFTWKGSEEWQNTSNRSLVDEMKIALEYSAKQKSSSGKTEYTKPDLKIEQEVYFFIQIPSFEELEKVANDPSSKPDDKSDGTKLTTKERLEILMGWLQKAGLSSETMKKGIWVKGKGTSVNDALADAIHTTFFKNLEAESEATSKNTIQFKVGDEVLHEYLSIKSQYGWFVSFMGWTDTGLKNGNWTYWSQYTYNPNAKTLDDSRQWSYNQLSLGMYDMSECHYFALILQTTASKEAGEGVTVNIPTPSDIPVGL